MHMSLKFTAQFNLSFLSNMAANLHKNTHYVSLLYVTVTIRYTFCEIGIFMSIIVVMSCFIV